MGCARERRGRTRKIGEERERGASERSSERRGEMRGRSTRAGGVVRTLCQELSASGKNSIPRLKGMTRSSGPYSRGGNFRESLRPFLGPLVGGLFPPVGSLLCALA